MKIKFLKLALKNVTRNFRRTLITGLIMIFGSVALILSGGFMKYSFWGLSEMAIRGQYGHLQLFNPKFLEDEEDVPLQYGIENSDSLIESINKLDRVQFAMPRIQFMGLISNGDRSVAFIGQAGIPHKERILAGTYQVVEQGRYLGQDSSSQMEDEVILANGLARSLKAKIGDYLTIMATTTSGALNALDIKVVGFLSTGIPELDARFLSVKLSTAQQLLRTNLVHNIVVVLDDTENTDWVAKQLAVSLSDLVVKKWNELATFYQAVVKLYNAIFSFLGVIIFVVVLLASSNTMMMSIFERTKEIGTLMAVGTSSNRLLANFLLEGLVIGGFSGLIGIILGLLFSYIINHSGLMMPPPPGSTNPYPLNVMYVPAVYISAFVFIVITAIISTLIPAYKAARTKIVDALGHI